MNDKGYIVVTDYVQANTGADVSDAIQKVIDDNPHRTIFFPDGEYIIAKPICTPADPAKAVSLELSSFATLRASDDWSSDEAMVRLGGKDACNNIHLCGSNYYFRGGIVDGNKIAKGISIDSGRETLITHVSIKNVSLGIHIKRGANNGSSDADIEKVNITGNNMPDSIGVLVDGYDNTLHNMRIAAVQTGVWLRTAGNSLRDIHPLFIFGYEISEKDPSKYDNVDRIDYYKSVGFIDESNGNNWYDYCYSDQMATGFRFGRGKAAFFRCFTMWYSVRHDMEVGYDCTDEFNATISSGNVELRADGKNRAYIKVAKEGGFGVIENPMFNPSSCDDDTYKKYLSGKIQGI